MYDYRHEAAHEEPLPGPSAVRVAAADTGTAPGRHGGRHVAAQPVPEPRRRGPVRGRGQAGPAVQTGTAAGHGEPFHGQRHGGRGGAVADDHGTAAVAGRDDHVRTAGARPERVQRVHVGRGRAGHVGRSRLRGVLDRAARDHRSGRIAAGAQRATAGHHMLPEGPVQVPAEPAASGQRWRTPGGGRPRSEVGQVQSGRGAGRPSAAVRRKVRIRPTPSASPPPPATADCGRGGRGNGTETSPPPRRPPPSSPSRADRGRTVAAAAAATAGAATPHAAADQRCGRAHVRRPRHDVPESGQAEIVRVARAPGRPAQRVRGARHAAQTAAAAQVDGGSVARVAAAAGAAGWRGHEPVAQDRHAQDAGGRHERDEGMNADVLQSPDALLHYSFAVAAVPRAVRTRTYRDVIFATHGHRGGNVTAVALDRVHRTPSNIATRTECFS